MGKEVVGPFQACPEIRSRNGHPPTTALGEPSKTGEFQTEAPRILGSSVGLGKQVSNTGIRFSIHLVKDTKWTWEKNAAIPPT